MECPNGRNRSKLFQINGLRFRILGTVRLLMSFINFGVTARLKFNVVLMMRHRSSYWEKVGY